MLSLEAARRCATRVLRPQWQQRGTPTWSAEGSVATAAPLRYGTPKAAAAFFLEKGGAPFPDVLRRLRESVRRTTSGRRAETGILEWYLGMIETRPVVTKSVTASAVFAAADISSQIVTNKLAGSFDIERTMRMAGYGMIVLGPTLHLWFNFISRILPKRDVITTLKKIFIGQTVFGPVMTATFFSINSFLQGESISEIVARIKRDVFPTIINGLLYWPMADFVTFKFIPVRLQPVICNTFSFFWTIYLTHIASSKKAGSDEIPVRQCAHGQSICSL